MIPDHDNAYKLLFSHAEMVESLIRDFVPEAWVKTLDFSTLEKQNGSYIADDLRSRHDDIIWRVRTKKSWLYIYLLLEFQSSIDPWMALRIMTYTGLLYQDLIKSGQVKITEGLPPVFPLVLYNGQGTWTARTELAELIMPISSSLARYSPKMRYFLLDEGRVPDKELQSDNLASYLMRMERSDSPEQLRQAVSGLKHKLNEPGYQSLRRAFTVWIHRVLLQRVMPKEPLPALETLEEVDTMLAERVVEWTEKWKMEGLEAGLAEGRAKGHAEGEAKGRVEGEVKGRAEGEVKGRSAVLRRLLAKRFGEDIWESRVQERLRTASIEELDLWAERILDARTIDEVFGE